MKAKLFFVATMVLVAFPIYSQKKTTYVRPNIGTAHSRWFFYTPASMPFGMAKLGPSTNAHYGNKSGWEAVGYDSRHRSIEGFANFHEFQVGGVVLAPTVGKVQTIPGELNAPEEGYRSRFNKKDERATAGYYSVLLKDYNIKAELTATKRVGFHRYTFPKSSEANIIFDIGNQQGESGAVKDAKVSLSSDGNVEGYVITEPEYVKKYQNGATVTMYFSAAINKKPIKFGAFRKSEIKEGATQMSGVGAGIYLTFETNADEKITVKVGLSYTSIGHARMNLISEANDLTFDEASAKNMDTWEEHLSRISVTTKDENDKIKFYTGLYHALLGRGLASDVNGAYPKNNGEVGNIEVDDLGQPLHNHYNTDAIWGAFWNLTQLWTLAYPEYFADWIQSQLLVYKDASWLGDGIANSRYVSGVGTNFTSLAIAAAHNCGIRNYDVNLAYKAALKNELESEHRIEGAGKMDVGEFVKRGYSPYVEEGDELNTNGSRFGASHTMEYSFSAYAVAQFAKALNKTDDYEQLMHLSKSWEKLYDAETGYIRPLDIEGKFIEPFDPSQPWRGFQEGNAIQYSFYVPHDAKELVNKIGADRFNERLDDIFTTSQKNVFGGGKTVDAFAGVSSLYNHGNQPCLHISWMFNFSGRPDLTQKWVRAICKEFYGTEDIHGYGYGQDEDQGQLGAWYVISSIGLFDVKGLTGETPSMQIGSPLFDEVTIKLNPQYYKGKEFTIKTVDNSDKNIYVKQASLNGTTLEENSVYFSDITNGGVLELQMGENSD